MVRSGRDAGDAVGHLRGLVYDKLVGNHDPGRSSQDSPVGFGGDAARSVHERFGDQGLHHLRLGLRCSSVDDPLGRTFWTLANSTNAVLREHYFRTLLWLTATTPLWIAGAAVSQEARLLWWALAAGLDQIGRWLAHPIPGRHLHSEHVPFNAEHMLERCRLFLIIALGETVLTTGSAIAEAPMTVMTLTTGTASLAMTVALWAMSFGRSHTLILQHLEETTDPIRTSRHAINALIIMVAGLIAVAVANEEMIAHPHGQTPVDLSLLLIGGPVLFLAAQGWYLRVVPRVWSKLHFIGGSALLLLGLGTLFVPPYAALILTGASLAILALVDQKLSSDPVQTTE